MVETPLESKWPCAQCREEAVFRIGRPEVRSAIREARQLCSVCDPVDPEAGKIKERPLTRRGSRHQAGARKKKQDLITEGGARGQTRRQTISAAAHIASGKPGHQGP